MFCSDWIPINLRSGVFISNSTLDQIYDFSCTELFGPLVEASAKMRSSDMWTRNSSLQYLLIFVITFMRLVELPGLAPLNRKEMLFSYLNL